MSMKLLTSSNSLGFFYSSFHHNYSPDLNPAEEAFSYIKGYLKKHDTLLQCGVSLTDIIQAGFDSITTTQCQSWITHSGYVKHLMYHRKSKTQFIHVCKHNVTTSFALLYPVCIDCLEICILYVLIVCRFVSCMY